MQNNPNNKIQGSLKVKLSTPSGEFRRFHFDQVPEWSELLEFVEAKVLHRHQHHQHQHQEDDHASPSPCLFSKRRFRVQYVDEEGDRVSIGSQQEWSEALEILLQQPQQPQQPDSSKKAPLVKLFVIWRCFGQGNQGGGCQKQHWRRHLHHHQQQHDQPQQGEQETCSSASFGSTLSELPKCRFLERFANSFNNTAVGKEDEEKKEDEQEGKEQQQPNLPFFCRRRGGGGCRRACKIVQEQEQQQQQQQQQLPCDANAQPHPQPHHPHHPHPHHRNHHRHCLKDQPLCSNNNSSNPSAPVGDAPVPAAPTVAVHPRARCGVEPFLRGQHQQRFVKHRLHKAGYQYLLQRDLQKAKECFEQLLKVSPDDDIALYNLACTHSLLSTTTTTSSASEQQQSEEEKKTIVENEQQKALELLRKAVSCGFTDAQHIEKDEDFAPLRGRKDFSELLSSLKKEKKEQEGQGEEKVLPVARVQAEEPEVQNNNNNNDDHQAAEGNLQKEKTVVAVVVDKNEREESEFQEELKQLEEMGFPNRQTNLNLLRSNGGNLVQVVARLLQ